jgi:predicted AlkP superfamily pyrophosphatase or phosphodiesterase
MASHVFGIEGPRFRSTLRKTDERVRVIVDTVRQRFGEVNMLAFSDHGMTPARSFRSLPELRRHRSFGKEFCFALDATMVRLWYLSDRPALREELRDLVASRLDGRWLSGENRRALHVDFRSRDYGDEIFLADPGQVIFPNFHSYVRPKAMHAYDPADPDQRGIVIVSGAAPALGERVEMVDIHALMTSLTGLGVAARRPAEAHA